MFSSVNVDAVDTAWMAVQTSLFQSIDKILVVLRNGVLQSNTPALAGSSSENVFPIPVDELNALVAQANFVVSPTDRLWIAC